MVKIISSKKFFLILFVERSSQHLVINTVPYPHHPSDMNSHDIEYKLTESIIFLNHFSLFCHFFLF